MDSLISADGTELYFCIDTVENARGAIFLVHGFGEHCGRYDQFVKTLNKWELSCFRFDYRGHGRSQGRRGHIDHFQDYLDDFKTAQAEFKNRFSALPQFLLGHSNGGLVSFLSLEHDQDSWTGVVLSSPFFGFEIKVPLWKRVLGNGLSRIIPQFQMPTELKGNQVSHDPDVIQAYDQDPLMGRVASARWFTEVVRVHENLSNVAQTLHVPLLIQAAGADQVVSVQDTQTLFESVSSPDQTLKVYEGLFHEIWFELEKDIVFTDLKETLERWLIHSDV